MLVPAARRLSLARRRRPSASACLGRQTRRVLGSCGSEKACPRQSASCDVPCMAEKRQAARSLLEPDDLDGLDVRQLDCVLHFKGSWPDRRQRRVNRALDRDLGGGENMSEGRRTNKQKTRDVNEFHCNQIWRPNSWVRLHGRARVLEIVSHPRECESTDPS